MRAAVIARSSTPHCDGTYEQEETGYYFSRIENWKKNGWGGPTWCF